MPYLFDGTQLRVVQALARQPDYKALLSNSRILLVEHLLPTVADFVRILRKEGGDVHAIFGKPYSVDKQIQRDLLSDGFRVEVHPYDVLENTTVIDRAIEQASRLSAKDKKKIILIDVGGYFCKPTVRLHKARRLSKFVRGVVEDTTFGHNRYLAAAKDLPISIYSVARSMLKEIEARFVGRDAVTTMDLVLRRCGLMLSGRNAMVLGYGMIGRNIARSLRAADMNVSVYDREDHKNLQAFIDGFHVHRKLSLIHRADIIYSATAEQALKYEEIEDCKDLVVLASVGSKDTEFDIETLKGQAVKCNRHGEHISEYALPNGKAIRVVKDGTAVNFILPSLPSELLDLVFSEIFHAMMLLHAGSAPKGFVHNVPYELLNLSAKHWLRNINN